MSKHNLETPLSRKDRRERKEREGKWGTVFFLLFACKICIFPENELALSVTLSEGVRRPSRRVSISHVIAVFAKISPLMGGDPSTLRPLAAPLRMTLGIFTRGRSDTPRFEVFCARGFGYRLGFSVADAARVPAVSPAHGGRRGRGRGIGRGQRIRPLSPTRVPDAGFCPRPSALLPKPPKFHRHRSNHRTTVWAVNLRRVREIRPIENGGWEFNLDQLPSEVAQPPIFGNVLLGFRDGARCLTGTRMGQSSFRGPRAPQTSRDRIFRIGKVSVPDKY